MVPKFKILDKSVMVSHHMITVLLFAVAGRRVTRGGDDVFRLVLDTQLFTLIFCGYQPLSTLFDGATPVRHQIFLICRVPLCLPL